MTEQGLSIGRRAFLAGIGGAAGLAVVRGFGSNPLSGAPTGAHGYELALRSFARSLTPGQRDLIVLPADHPSREVTNTLTFLERPHLGTLLSPEQLASLSQLVETMLSGRGQRDFAGTLAVEGKLEGSTLAIYGEPETGTAQATILGGHVHLRGGAGPSGAPLGGGVAYGHQIGNHKWKVAGNSFAYHGDAANRLFRTLPAEARERAIVAQMPHELVLQLQSNDGRFDGISLRDVGEEAHEAAERLVDNILGLYPPAAREGARAALDFHGGVGSLHLSVHADKGFYEDMQPWSALDPPERTGRGDPYWQVWRLEGPGAVFHFRGHPHVHAYVHVVGDPKGSHVGETLAVSPVLLEGEPLRDLLEGALRAATGTVHAWMPPSAPGRFCPGPITTGLAWSLDPYANEVVVAEVPGERADSPVAERLAAKSGGHFEAGRPFRIATTDYAVREVFPDAALEPTGLKLRDALVSHLRAGALEG